MSYPIAPSELVQSPVGGESRAELVVNFLKSPEHRERHARALFQEFLGNEPGEDAVRFWSRWLATARRTEEVASGLLGSPEFADRWGLSHGNFVRTLYRLLLRRAPSQAEFSCWVGVLDSQSATRYSVALAFLETDEYRERRIRQWFHQYLHREPERDEVTYWLAEARQSSTLDDVLKAILSSGEYWESR